jgi:3-methyladenine DNA glycosylase AlkD
VTRRSTASRKASDPTKFFRDRFRAVGTEERADYEKAYMKSELAFHGVTMPQVRATCADWVREQESEGSLDRDVLLRTVRALVATDYFDLRSAGIALLERRRKLLQFSDVPWLIELVRKTQCWAHVDWLATNLIGPLVQDTPKMKPLLRAWAKDEDFWIRRTALLAQLVALRSGEGDFALFSEIALPMLEEKEFFIRKAIGWVLRETGKKRPTEVRRFLADHGTRMAGLTRREAEKGLS